jgi:hypothetical protein
VYDVGTLTDKLFIEKTGEYASLTFDTSSNVAYFSNAMVNTVTQVAVYDYIEAYTTEQKIQASGLQTYNYYGQSVSISGDYAVVGVHYKDSQTGAAYIYKRDSSTGLWGNEQKIQASDKQTGDEFGVSVSISGDYAIVGARSKNTATGAAYIYTRDPSTGVWGSEYKIQASDKADGHEYGFSVSISGDYAIVGARGRNSYTGAAYIYTRNGTSWGSEQRILGEASQDKFGYSVSISGDYAIVGAHNKNSGTGAAYIYTRNGTSWGSEQRILGEASQDNFGWSVSMSGDYAIVGAYLGGSTGAAYVFKRNGTSWGSEQIILGETTGDQFGRSVSINGDYAIVGAPAEDTGGSNAGAVYVFKREGTTWSEIKKITASDSVDNDNFGYSVAIDGTYAIVGAVYENSSTGAAYIYEAPDIVPKLTHDGYNKLSIENNTPTATTLTYDSNTYDLGTRTDVYIDKVGTYDAAITTSDKFALVSNVVGTVTQVDAVYDYTQMDTTEQKITASDKQTSDEFGRSVSISSDYAIVGARGEDTGGSAAGAAYIYVRSGTTWSQQQKIQASDKQASDYFGQSVSLSGDYAIVGAYSEDTGGTSAGAAYIYTRDPSTGVWGSEQKIQANDKQTNELYGYSVSISGDYAIVGARDEDTGGEDAGAAYIYKRDSSTGVWGSEQKIQASDKQSIDLFGYSVSISGDYAIVGSFYEDTGGTNAGAAYIYTRDPSTGVWGSEQKIMASDAAAQDNFGNSVSISGDYVIVGAPYEDTGFANAGAAYIYTRDPSTGVWGSEYKIQAGDRQANDNFGYSVSISGDYAIVGAYYEDTGGTDAGAAYIFKREGTTWSEIKKITASDAAQGDEFGWSVAIDGTYAIVGARYEDSYTGAAYIYEAPNIVPKLTFDTYNKLSIENITPTASTLRLGSNTYDIGTATDIYIEDTGTYEIETKDANTFALVSNVVGTVTQIAVYDYTQMDTTEQKILGETSQDQFGYSASISGDYAIVGALYEDTGATDAGAAYIYTRDASTGVWGSEQKIQASDKEESDFFGYSVSIDGDYAIVGARNEDTGGSEAGAAYIYTRDPSTGVWGNEQKIQASDKQTQDRFGISVSISGDYAIVGARYEDAGGSDAGAAYIYTRNSSTGVWGNEQKIQASDKQTQDAFGFSVSISGDYAIVGARYEDAGGAEAGAAYIYKRDSSTGVWGSEQKLLGEASQDQFGSSVSISGDYAIVGAPYEDTGVTNAGAAYIYTRDASTGVWGNEQKLTESDIQQDDYFGFSVSISGDYAIVGAIFQDTGGVGDTGAAYIYKRTGTTWSKQTKLTASDGEASDYFGYSVAIDGTYAIVTANFENSYTGAAYIYEAPNIVPKLTFDTYNKLSIQNITPTSTSLRLGSNTFDIGTATDIYIQDTGTYEIETKDANTFALVSNVVGTVTQIAVYDYTDTTEQKITAGDPEQDDELGWSVSISGDYAIVGTRSKNSYTGAAYVFKRGVTTWSQQQRILGETSQDQFGYSVSRSGDYMIVGAIGVNNKGAAYIYKRDASTGVWGNEQKIQASDNVSSARFGSSTSISGDYAIVGAYYDSTGGAQAGAAYIYTRSGTTWGSVQKIQASDQSNINDRVRAIPSI